MIKEPLTNDDIKTAAYKYAGDVCRKRTAGNMAYSVMDFMEAAQWRINSVWHDCDDRSAATNNKYEVVLLLENGKIVEYEDNWEECCSLVKKWAYKKDLLPNKED